MIPFARDCSTCTHQVRDRRTDYCVRPTRHDSPPIYVQTALVFGELCSAEREPGRWLSYITGMCGQRGRYWRAK